MSQVALSLLNAQSTFGTVLGTVKDPASAIIVGVQVRVTNEGTNISHAIKTDENGSYEVTHLNPGLYRVEAEFPGFQRYVNQRINLETGQILRIDVQMTMGQLTDTVTVEGQAPVVESETGTIADIRTGRQMRLLPLNTVRGDAFSGGIFKYMSLTPGSFRYEGSTSHSFGGSRGAQNSFIFDGTSLGDQGGTQITAAQPSFETVQEMKLTMVNNSAEYGAVATITITSKSGTNELHGSAFHQYSSGGLNARNFFQTTVPFRVYNEFGGSMGGPVVLPGYKGRNRTFFFGAYEGNRDHRQTIFNTSVPSLALRRGDFSQVLNSAGNLIVIRDPLNGQPFASNAVPPGRPSTVSLKVQDKFYPAPNYGPPTLLSQNLRDTAVNPPSWDHFDGRIDHKFGDANSLYGRFTWRNIPRPAAEGTLPGMGVHIQNRKIRNVSLVDTHVISPRVVNELRAGYAWHSNPRESPIHGLAVVRELGIRGVSNLDRPGVPVFNITGFTSISGTDFDRPQEMTWDFIDNVTFMTGRHSLKVGVNFRKNQASAEPAPGRIFGSYDFTNAFSGFSYADFLLGLPQTTQRYTPRSRTYGRNQSWAGYLQDDVKLHPKLTLNLGLRYQWVNPFADRYDRMFNFDPRTGNLVVPTETVLKSDVSPIFPASIKIVTAQEAGFPRRGLRTGDGNNFDPRFGFAWRPLGHARSVLRGGMGFFRNNLSSSTFESQTGGPFVSNETFTNRIVSGVPLFQFPEPFLAVGSLGSQDVTAVEPHIFNPYTMQWNLTAEQELASIGFRLSYIGTRSVNLLYRRNFNQPGASVIAFNNNRRPFPQYRNITMVSNGNTSSYHGMQLEAERKLARGLYFQAGWTWAKSLADGIDAGEQGPAIENAYNRSADRGDDLYQRRHRVVGNYIWELPFGPGQRWGSGLRGLPGQIAGGWRIAGIVLLQTGQLFTPTFSGSDPSNTNTVGGRPDRLGNGNLPRSERTINRWFDAAAFVAPPANAGRFGSAGIGILEGPGTKKFDIGLYKEFRFKERGRVELQVSATNFPNHPNFLLPAANISAPTSVGRITTLQAQDETGARTLMLGSRIEF